MAGTARTLAVAAGTLAVLAVPALLGDALLGAGAVPLTERTAAGAGATSPGDSDRDAPAATDGTGDRTGAGTGDGASGAADGTAPVPRAARPLPVGVAAPVVGGAAPVAIRLPTLGVDAASERLGTRRDGSLAAPADPDRVGWYTAGVEPGQPGPAVMAGHVDSQDGPAVFHRLGELVPGDPVEVVRADGSTLRFTVDALARHRKDDFPTEDVYGPVPGPELRLITCTGTFDDATGHYRSNLVVFASLA